MRVYSVCRSRNPSSERRKHTSIALIPQQRETDALPAGVDLEPVAQFARAPPGRAGGIAGLPLWPAQPDHLVQNVSSLQGQRFGLDRLRGTARRRVFIFLHKLFGPAGFWPIPNRVQCLLKRGHRDGSRGNAGSADGLRGKCRRRVTSNETRLGPRDIRGQHQHSGDRVKAHKQR